MVVLITGANGFIGRHLAQTLVASGHEVVGTTRNLRSVRLHHPRFRYVEADFSRDFDLEDWLPRLAGVDVVINAVGILRESGQQTFEALHSKTPRALFSACAAAGVGLVVQISALGADREAKSRYHLSKKEADDFLAGLPVPFVIVQPSLVYGPGGASARLFDALASLPLIALPGRGDQSVQPIHIDDLTAAILALLETDLYRRCRIPLVGPQPVSLRDFLARLRQVMGLGRARFLPVPMPIVQAAARLGPAVPGHLLDTETLGMLQRGNTGDAEPVRRLLGRHPRRVEDFVTMREAPAVRTLARLQWLLPPLRVSVALVWIVTGILSLGVYPVEESYALLARVGITGWLAPVLLYGAALLDLAIGMAILVLDRRRWLWLAQGAVILFYSVVIAWKLPEFWLHPYGPMLKNLPLLVVIGLLYELEER